MLGLYAPGAMLGEHIRGPYLGAISGGHIWGACSGAMFGDIRTAAGALRVWVSKTQHDTLLLTVPPHCSFTVNRIGKVRELGAF